MYIKLSGHPVIIRIKILFDIYLKGILDNVRCPWKDCLGSQIVIVDYWTTLFKRCESVSVEWRYCYVLPWVSFVEKHKFSLYLRKRHRPKDRPTDGRIDFTYRNVRTRVQRYLKFLTDYKYECNTAWYCIYLNTIRYRAVLPPGTVQCEYNTSYC